MAPTKAIIGGLLTILVLSQCNSDEKEYYFGDPVYEFDADSIYFCETDGILKIDYHRIGAITSLGKPTGYLYSDEDPDPSTEVAIIYYTCTIPINRGMYWKIKSLTNNEYIISWTPLLYN